MHKAAPLLAILLAPAILSCTVQAAASHRLADNEWRFVQIDELAPDAEEARLAFDDGGLSASVGCNAMGGNWRVENERLIAGPLMQTEMYCPGLVWEQEQSVSALLVAGPKIRFEDDRLYLTARRHSAVLEAVTR